MNELTELANKYKSDKGILDTAEIMSHDYTELQLQNVGIFYDQLIMGLNRGERIVINDKKPYGDMVVASGIELKRNEGIGGLEL